MHSAAPQMRVRPDSATSTPLRSAVSAAEVRSKRSRTCGENANNPTANTAPSANTTASLRRPSARQPDKASTSA